MPVPSADCTKNSSSNGMEGSQPKPRVLKREELEMGPKPFGAASKIMCRAQTLEQKAVKFQDVRTLRYLPRKAVNTE